MIIGKSDIIRKNGKIFVEKIRRIDVIELEKQLDRSIGGNNFAEVNDFLSIENTQYPLSGETIQIIAKCINRVLYYN